MTGNWLNVATKLCYVSLAFPFRRQRPRWSWPPSPLYCCFELMCDRRQSIVCISESCGSSSSYYYFKMNTTKVVLLLNNLFKGTNRPTSKIWRVDSWGNGDTTFPPKKRRGLIFLKSIRQLWTRKDQKNCKRLLKSCLYGLITCIHFDKESFVVVCIPWYGSGRWGLHENT